jgi:hypothetical protein
MSHLSTINAHHHLQQLPWHDQLSFQLHVDRTTIWHVRHMRHENKRDDPLSRSKRFNMGWRLTKFSEENSVEQNAKNAWYAPGIFNNSSKLPILPMLAIRRCH